MYSCLYSSHTTNASIEEFRELEGFAIDTFLKNVRICEYNKLVSFPRNIFATNLPPTNIQNKLYVQIKLFGNNL